MQRTLFISDLHLAEERPSTADRFARFLAETVPVADALYILGDLFEYWVGDDGLSLDFPARIADFLRLAARATPVFFMHGNRDFMVASRFCAETGIRLIPDPTVIDLYGERALLMHGDTLCTGDQAYLAFRAQVRNPAWQAAALVRPLAERVAIARGMRERSEDAKGGKGEAILDVAPEAVEAAFVAADSRLMIHGHTHRPARHEHEAGGRTCIRWVLPDWYEAGGYLEASPSVIRAVPLD
ncbi:MAG: UDP-2,3-diacylglucosamine diphosphatase [Betaproteobacteria bacterium]|nr:UDP-2,3-diacylglucosamine diphosphatase [Betaproteobacteria bacterium]